MKIFSISMNSITSEIMINIDPINKPFVEMPFKMSGQVFKQIF